MEDMSPPRHTGRGIAVTLSSVPPWLAPSRSASVVLAAGAVTLLGTRRRAAALERAAGDLEAALVEERDRRAALERLLRAEQAATAALAGSSTLDQALEQLTTGLSDALGWRPAGVFRPRDGALELVTRLGVAPIGTGPGAPRAARRHLERCALEAARHAELRTSDVDGGGTVAALPVLQDAEVVACLVLESLVPRTIDPELAAFVLSLSVKVAEFAERVGAAERAAEQAQDLATVGALARRLAHAPDLEAVREAICQIAVRLVGGRTAVLLERLGDEPALRPVAATGSTLSSSPVALDATPSPVSRAFVRPGWSLGEAPAELFGGQRGLRGALYVPVQRHGMPVAVVAIGWPQGRSELSSREIDLLGLLADEAANALERAHLTERLAADARTDALTGLPNVRAWRAGIARMLDRARREDEPLTVVMLDLDHFKAFNDEHGHLAGDRLLKGAASAWREQLRTTDLLARHGGEEFALALAGCALDEALEIVERVRAATPEGQTCSAGAALWDGHDDADALRARADQALYAAKQAGRARTEVA